MAVSDVMAVLVTGARGGIGRATVEMLRKSGLETLEMDLEDGVDAADSVAVREFLSESAPDFLSGVVALAGFAGLGGIDEVDYQAWRDTLRTNLDSAYVTVRESLPYLRKCEGDKSIVLLSSINGRNGGNVLSGPGYAVAKAGLIGLARHLAVTLGPEGIRANAIAPGPVDTAMYQRLDREQRDRLEARIPLRRISSPSEIAGIIQFLFSPASSAITGSVIDVNGGAWVG